MYKDGGINVVSAFSNLTTISNAIVGYPHVGFDGPSMFPIKLSKFNSFNVSTSYDFYAIEPINLPVDFSYDFFIQASTQKNSSTLYEVMIWEFWNDYCPLSRPLAVLQINGTINGHQQKVTWLLFKGFFSHHTYPTFIFVPVIFSSRNMSWSLDLPEFIGALQHVLKHTLKHYYIDYIAVGGEFGSSIFTSETCDWSLYYYYEVNNQKNNLLGNA